MKPNRIFVLTVGRSGSHTFYEACKHITNYSVGHEMLSTKLGIERFAYPMEHIEIDCRLAWFLGKLNKYFPENVYYVHLKRNLDDMAKSWVKRLDVTPKNLLYAYYNSILMATPGKHNPSASLFDYALDMVRTVDINIANFLECKPHINIEIDNDVVRGFDYFCDKIEAKVDVKEAHHELSIKHSAS